MENNNKPEFLFDKVNYKILLVGLAVIGLGFILMSGGGSEDPNVFNGEELFSFRRIRLYFIFYILSLFCSANIRKRK